MKRILSLLMAAVTSLSLAACSADTPEESQYQSQVVSADYAGDFTAADAGIPAHGGTIHRSG